jgi:acetyl esterase
VAAHATDLGADARRMAVGGDSSGGNLAAAVILLAKDRVGPAFVHQLLVHPDTDYQAGADSCATSPTSTFNPRAVEWYWAMYLAFPATARTP